MLIHFSPRLFSKIETNIELFSFSSKELGLSLLAGKDLIADRPFPNRCYMVVRHVNSAKAVNGFLVETDRPIQRFTTHTRWLNPLPGQSIETARVINHIVEYEVLDQEYDAISEAMILWYGIPGTDFKDRWPKDTPANWNPLNAQPCMELTPMSRKSDVEVSVAGHGDIATIEQRESVRMHTIERSRILDGWPGKEVRDQMPAIETAVHVNLPIK